MAHASENAATFLGPNPANVTHKSQLVPFVPKGLHPKPVHVYSEERVKLDETWELYD